MMHYDTFGGTAVSTSHLHIDDFALCYIPELLELSELTGNKEWKERSPGCLEERGAGDFGRDAADYG